MATSYYIGVTLGAGCRVGGFTLMALRETPLADPLTLRPEMTSETAANDMVLLL